MQVNRSELRRLISGAKRVFVDFWFSTGEGQPNGQTNLVLPPREAMKLADLATDKDVFTVYAHETGVTAGSLYIESGRKA